MKKTVLAILLLVFAVITFAETPKIVNPPRPTKEFKLLLVIVSVMGDNLGITKYSRYLYTNAYHLEKSNDGIILYSDTDYQSFTFIENGGNTGIAGLAEFLFAKPPGIVMYLQTSYNGIQNVSFWKVKAPRPDWENINMAKPPVAEITENTTPKKAKVVFIK